MWLKQTITQITQIKMSQLSAIALNSLIIHNYEYPVLKYVNKNICAFCQSHKNPV